MRILIADDQDLMRTAMSAVLIKEPDVWSVALANDGAQAITCSRAEPFDVVVLDVAMPVMSGIAALTMLRCELPALPVVMLSVSTDPYTVRHCLELGARGYIAKESAFDELIKAVRSVVAGESYLCKVVQAALV